MLKQESSRSGGIGNGLRGLVLSNRKSPLSFWSGFLADEIRYKFEQWLRVRFDVVVRSICDSFCHMSA